MYARLSLNERRKLRPGRSDPGWGTDPRNATIRDDAQASKRINELYLRSEAMDIDEVEREK